MTIWTGTAPTFAAGVNTGNVTRLNDIRDAVKAVSEAWTSYGSVSSWTSTGTPVSAGNATWVGRYRRVSKAVEFYAKITMGSTTTYGTGNYRLALPVTPHASEPGWWTVVASDNSTGAFYTGNIYSWTGTTAACVVILPAGGVQQVTNTVPWTWATSDWLMVRGSYEAA